MALEIHVADYRHARNRINLGKMSVKMSETGMFTQNSNVCQMLILAAPLLHQVKTVLKYLYWCKQNTSIRQTSWVTSTRELFT